MTTRKRARSAPVVAPQPAVPDQAPPAAADSLDPGLSAPEVEESAPPAPTGQAPPAAPAAPPHPVKRYRIASPPPTRAGGYVLTERGWVPDTDPEV